MSKINKKIQKLSTERLEKDVEALKKLLKSYKSGVPLYYCPLCDSCGNDSGSITLCEKRKCIRYIISDEICVDIAGDLGTYPKNLRRHETFIARRKIEIPIWIKLIRTELKRRK